MIMEMWSPFQSKVVREICANITPEEKPVFRKRAFLYGLWIDFSLLIPLVLAIVRPAVWSFILAIVGVVTHILYLPVWQRKEGELLCRTEWARSRGITSDKLPLFKGHRR
jgi:hypothetical protein